MPANGRRDLIRRLKVKPAIAEDHNDVHDWVYRTKFYFSFRGLGRNVGNGV